MALQSGAPPSSWGSQSCCLEPPTASHIRAGSRWGVCVSVFGAARDRQRRSCLAAERTGRRRPFPQTHLRRGCASVLAAASFWNRIPQVWALPFTRRWSPFMYQPGEASASAEAVREAGWGVWAGAGCRVPGRCWRRGQIHTGGKLSTSAQTEANWG